MPSTTNDYAFKKNVTERLLENEKGCVISQTDEIPLISLHTEIC